MSIAASAFGQGSDARLAGLPLSACPYRSADGYSCVYWKMGWWDVNDFWANQARWIHRKLPPVREATHA